MIKSVVLFFGVFFFLFQTTALAQFGPGEPGESRRLFVVESSSSPASVRPRIVAAGPDKAGTSATPAVNPADLERTTFDLLNQQRAAFALPALAWCDEVARIARLHSENMARHQFFSHQGADGLWVHQRADRSGLSRWTSIGENIAYNRGYADPAAFAVSGWMNSSSHRENILGARWKESAVGVAIAGDGAVYFTQVFLLRR